MRYSKILSKVIKTAKMLHYNNQIIHSHNKIKATWNFIKSESGEIILNMIKQMFIIMVRNTIKMLKYKTLISTF